MNTNDCALGTNKMYSNLSVFLCLCMKWLISRQGNGYSTNMSKTVYKIQHEELSEGDNKPVDSFYASISVRPEGGTHHGAPKFGQIRSFPPSNA